MKKLQTLENNMNKAMANYDAVKEEIKEAKVKINAAAQLFSMNEISKKDLEGYIQAANDIAAKKAEAWDKVVEATVAFNKLSKSIKREEKVAALKDLLK